MSEQTPNSESPTPSKVESTVERAISGFSDALDQGINAVLRQVIRGQLAVGEAETAVQDVRAAVAEATDRARMGRKRVQLALLEIVEAEINEQLAGLRALAQAEDPKAIVNDRMQHMQDTLNRQANALGRLQEEQQAALRDAFEPLEAIAAKLRGDQPV